MLRIAIEGNGEFKPVHEHLKLCCQSWGSEEIQTTNTLTTYIHTYRQNIQTLQRETKQCKWFPKENKTCVLCQDAFIKKGKQQSIW